MVRFSKLVISLIVTALMLSACGFLPTPTPTSTATPMPSDTPTMTATSTATKTPRPTFTVTPTVQVASAEVINMIGGYALVPPPGHTTIIYEEMTNLTSPGEIYFYDILPGNIGALDGAPIEQIMEEMASSAVADGMNFNFGDVESVKIKRYNSKVAVFESTYLDRRIEGKIAAIFANETRFVMVLGIGPSQIFTNTWEKEGEEGFRLITENLRFLSSSEMGIGDACTISTDSTYGYTKENAIKVGGDAFEGPARERMYLMTLAGLNGEEISFVRTGSLNYKDTILDAYQVTITGRAPVTLYIDEYSYVVPQAPVGFSCLGAFPFTDP